MGYYAADINDYIADIASVGGWHDFVVWADKQKGLEIHHLVELGVSHNPQELAKELAASQSPLESVQSTIDGLVACAVTARHMLIISDGVGGEEDDERLRLSEDVAIRLSASFPGWKRIHAAARSVEGPFKKHVTHAIESAKKELSRGKLKAALATSHSAAEAEVDDAIVTFRKELGRGLPELLLEGYNAGGDAAVKNLKAKMRVSLRAQSLRAAADLEDFSFGVSSEDAVKWARRHAGEMVTQVTDTTISDIREAIISTLDGDTTIEEAADSIFDAIGDEARADLIASHEVMTAASEGQRDAWDQARDEGLLTEKNTKEWIITAGDACPRCQAIADQGPIPLDEDYDDDGDEVDGPPLHVRCECTEGIAS